jgi:hypothetical protein
MSALRLKMEAPHQPLLKPRGELPTLRFQVMEAIKRLIGDCPVKG